MNATHEPNMRVVTYRTGCGTYMSREGAGCLESAKRRAVERVRLRDRKIEKRRVRKVEKGEQYEQKKRRIKIKVEIEKRIKMKKRG